MIPCAFPPSPTRVPRDRQISTENLILQIDLAIAKLEMLSRNCGPLDPGGEIRKAIARLNGLRESVCRLASPPPPFDLATSQINQDLRAIAASESPADASSLPLVSTGQGDFRRDVYGDERTGRLDIRA